jgi:2-phosphoglycerate kinase
MKINGNLVFDSASGAEIQNLRVEKLTGNELNAITAAATDVGRLVFVTTASTGGTARLANVLYQGKAVGGVYSFVAVAGNVQEEIDALEVSLGSLINGDGTFNAAALTGTLAGSTSITNLFSKLQELVAAEEARALAAEGVLTADLATEVARATAAEGVLTADLATEVARATAAEGVLTADLATEVARATAAEGVLTADLATETAARIAADTAESTARIAADAVLTADLATEVARATAAEAVLTADLATEVARATAAEAVLTAAVTAEETRALAAEAVLTADLATEVARATAAEGVLTADLATEVARAIAEEALIRGEMAAAIVGLSWENPVDSIAATLPTPIPAVGYRVANTTDNKLYTVTAAGWDAGEALVEGAAFFNNADDAAYTFNGTAIVQFNGAAGITAGAGMIKSGNTLYLASNSATITVSEDSIDVAQSVLDSITLVQTNLNAETAARILDVDTEEARALAAEGVLQAAITQEASDRAAADSAELARATAAEGVLTADLATEVARATAAEGVLTTDLAAEVARATAAEGVLTTDLAAEVARATAAEGVLTADIATVAADLATEEARALAAEGALGARIDGMYYLHTQSVAGSTWTVSHGIGQKFCNVTVVDGSDQVIIPNSITFDSTSQLTVTFTSAIAGKVVVMGVAAV